MEIYSQELCNNIIFFALVYTGTYILIYNIEIRAFKSIIYFIINIIFYLLYLDFGMFHRQLPIQLRNGMLSLRLQTIFRWSGKGRRLAVYIIDSIRPCHEIGRISEYASKNVQCFGPG